MTISVNPPQMLNLEAGLCACPFDVLGIHADPAGKGLVIRAWRPDAVALRVIESPSGKMLGEMTAVGHGLFELHLPRRRKTFSYELEVCWENSHSFRIFDPYSFGQYVLREEGLDYNRLYRHLGALPLSHAFNTRRKVEGVLFKVYAPNARSVKVVGSFNDWDERLHPMASADDGIWRLFIPGLQAGDHYKYVIHDQHGQQLPLKADPFAHHIEQWPGLASVVPDTQPYSWQDSHWMNSRHQIKTGEKPVSVYEVHAGSWRQGKNSELFNYRELAHELVPYVQEMGFTHIELLPISEHPLTESWGYQPVGMFAPTSRFGSPDDFRYFVDQCHKAGIGVLLDWVPAHFPEDAHGLAKFDGTALFEHPDLRRGWHPDWKTCIYDFGKPWVQDFLISNALYWLDEYHIDGLRVDAVASMLYLDYSRNHGEWEPNIHGGNENIEAVAFLRKFNETIGREFPDALTVAEESTSWPGVSRPVEEGGLGFDYKWNMGWMNDSLEYMKREPVHRPYHHRDITFSSVYAWSERFVLPLSHDEVVHGKGTLLTRMPGDEWQKFANLRAYLTFMFAHPGKKLLFMGAELGTDLEWNEKGTLAWSLLNNAEGFNAGIQKLVKDLNRLYVSTPALHELDLSDEGFAWTIGDDNEQSVLVFRRYDKAGNCTIITSNMTPVIRYDYGVGVPEAGKYEELLNSDDTLYGGSGITTGANLETVSGQVHGDEQYLPLTLPPLATVILHKKV